MPRDLRPHCVIVCGDRLCLWPISPVFLTKSTSQRPATSVRQRWQVRDRCHRRGRVLGWALGNVCITWCVPWLMCPLTIGENSMPMIQPVLGVDDGSVTAPPALVQPLDARDRSNAFRSRLHRTRHWRGAPLAFSRFALGPVEAHHGPERPVRRRQLLTETRSLRERDAPVKWSAEVW